MKKRILAVAAASVAVASALAGCSQGTTNAGGSGSTTITFAHWGNDQENATMNAMVAAFEKAHPDIKVKANWVQNNYEQQLQTTIAGGTAPDVAQISNSSLGQFASTFKPVEVKSSDFYSSNIAASMKFDGKYYATPFTVKTKTMAINKAVFDKAGVAVPSSTDPLTPDEYATLAKSLVSPTSPKTYGAAPLGFDQWLTIYGGSQFSADGKQCTYDSDAAVSAAEQVISAQSPDGYAPTQAEANGQDMFGWLTTGRLAMFPDFGPWSIAQLAQLPNSSDFALVPVPGKGSSMEIDGLGISSTASSDKVAAAKKFVNFMATDPAAQKLLTTAKSSLGLPVIEAAKSSALAAAPDQNIEAFFSAVSQSTIAPSFSKEQSNINGTIETDLSSRTAVGSGSESPKKVLTELNKTCQSQLKSGS